MRINLSQVKLVIYLLIGMILLNALLWFVSDVKLYGHNYMTPNLKIVLAYSIDIYALFLICLTNFIVLRNRKKRDGLTSILKYGVFTFLFLLTVQFFDLRLVASFHQPLLGKETQFLVSFVINNLAYLMTTVYFVLLTVNFYNLQMKIASFFCALSQITMLVFINVEFRFLMKSDFIFHNIDLIKNGVDTFIYASFVWLAYTVYKATRSSVKDENENM